MSAPIDLIGPIHRAARSAEASAGLSRFARYRDDLEGFGKRVLLHGYWPAQEYRLRAIIKYRKVAERAARKVSKTYTLGDMIVGFVNTEPTEAIVVSASWDQVINQTFARINAIYQEERVEELLGSPDMAALRIGPEWFAIGRSTNKADRIQGYHGGIDVPLEAYDPDMLAHAVKSRRRKHRLLLAFDEAAGIEPFIYNAIEGSLSGDNVYFVAQGNPTQDEQSDHPYRRMFDDGSGYHRIHVGHGDPGDDPVGSDQCFHEVPKWVVPDDPVTGVPWSETAYGGDRDSPLYQCYVLGKFAGVQSERQIIPLRLLLEALGRDPITDTGKVEDRHIGVDVAREGSDMNVACLTINGCLAGEHEWKTQPGSTHLMESAGVVIELMDRWGIDGQQVPASNVHVDIGMGAGVIDRLRQTGRVVDGVHFGERARYEWKHITGEYRFANRKTELHWVVKRHLEEGLTVVPRKYAEVWRQAQWATYDFAEKPTGTEITMGEKKDDLKDKYGRSPDNWDAFMLCFSRKVQPRIETIGTGKWYETNVDRRAKLRGKRGHRR